MPRRLLVIERSPLARNIYNMILSKLDEISLSSAEASDSISEIEQKALDADLLIISGSTLADRKGEFLDLVKKVSKNNDIPCLLLVKEGHISDWSSFAGLKKVKIIERPFFPKDFMAVVQELWGV